jgi:hypothetical protein
MELTDRRKSQSVASPGRGQQICAGGGGDVVVLDTKSGQWTYDDSHSLSQIQRTCQTKLP